MDLQDVVGYKDNTWISWIRSREELMDLIFVSEAKSNRSDYWSAFEAGCDYEETRYKQAQKRKRVYGVSLDVLFPRNATQAEIDMFVRIFMQSLDPEYKENIPYVYYRYGKGNGEYLKIVALQRVIYHEPVWVEKRYTQDYVYDSKTGKACSRDNPNAVVRKKGDLVIRNGEPVMVLQQCGLKKNRCFNCKCPDDKEIQTYFKKNLIDHIHEKVRNALAKINHLGVGKAKQVKKEKKTNRENVWQQVKRIKYNLLVSKINKKLSLYCYLVEQGKTWLEQDEMSALQNAYYSCANSLKAIFRQKSFKDGNLKYCFDIESHGDCAKRLSLTQFTENLNELKRYLIQNKLIVCEKKINAVLGDVFTHLTPGTYEL